MFSASAMPDAAGNNSIVENQATMGGQYTKTPENLVDGMIDSDSPLRLDG